MDFASAPFDGAQWKLWKRSGQSLFTKGVVPVCHQITLRLLIELKLRGQALLLFSAMALFPLASKGGGT